VKISQAWKFLERFEGILSFTFLHHPCISDLGVDTLDKMSDAQTF
jgi:hypothetical protein